jgi:hypothetical protein
MMNQIEISILACILGVLLLLSRKHILDDQRADASVLMIVIKGVLFGCCAYVLFPLLKDSPVLACLTFLLVSIGSGIWVMIMESGPASAERLSNLTAEERAYLLEMHPRPDSIFSNSNVADAKSQVAAKNARRKQLAAFEGRATYEIK